MNKQAVGFIGLGNIGKPMAKNLIGDAFEVSVYDVAAAPVAELQALGARSASLAEIARHCDIIGICVRDNNDIENLLYGDTGLLAHAAPGTVLAIHSTITQQALKQWVADAARHELLVIDAPITGGAHGADARELVYMVGGDANTLERCRGIFNTSAKTIVHAGQLGAGIALKLCINMMTYSSFIAVLESTRLAEAAGLDPQVLYQVGQANGVVGDFNHRFISNRGAVFDGCDEATARAIFEPFGKLGEKDLDAALETAAALGLELPAATSNRQLIMDTFIKP
jgi:3-hydroxyisobutyrate dehydrogenase